MCKGGHSSFLHGVPPGVKLSNNIKKSELGRYTAKPSYDIVGGGAGQPGEAQQGRHARRGHTQRWWSTLHLAPGRWLYLQPHSQQVCPEAGAGGQALQRQHQVVLHALAERRPEVLRLHHGSAWLGSCSPLWLRTAGP